MHKILENTHPKIWAVFSSIVCDIVTGIHEEMCEDNFYALVRFGCENWVEKNKEDSTIPWTPKMRQLLFEITCEALLEAYKFDDQKLRPEIPPCKINQ